MEQVMNELSLKNASVNLDANVEIMTKCANTIRDALREDLDGIEKIDIIVEPQTFYRLTFSVYPKGK